MPAFNILYLNCNHTIAFWHPLKLPYRSSAGDRLFVNKVGLPLISKIPTLVIIAFPPRVSAVLINLNRELSARHGFSIFVKSDYRHTQGIAYTHTIPRIPCFYSNKNRIWVNHSRMPALRKATAFFIDSGVYIYGCRF